MASNGKEMHPIEETIITGGCVISLLSLWFIPRKDAVPASFIFMLTQSFSWILGLLAVEFVWLDYPIRELAKANSTSFVFQFLILPILTIHFVLHCPCEKPIGTRIFYYIAFSSAFTFVEYLLERYTLVIHYYSWRWYWTWISMSLLFYIVKVIYKWYFKAKNIFSI